MPWRNGSKRKRKGLCHKKKATPQDGLFSLATPLAGAANQWNCSSSVEPVRAFTEDVPPWITVVTSSK